MPKTYGAQLTLVKMLAAVIFIGINPSVHAKPANAPKDDAQSELAIAKSQITYKNNEYAEIAEFSAESLKLPQYTSQDNGKKTNSLFKLPFKILGGALLAAGSVAGVKIGRDSYLTTIVDKKKSEKYSNLIFSNSSNFSGDEIKYISFRYKDAIIEPRITRTKYDTKCGGGCLNFYTYEAKIPENVVDYLVDQYEVDRFSPLVITTSNSNITLRIFPIEAAAIRQLIKEKP